MHELVDLLVLVAKLDFIVVFGLKPGLAFFNIDRQHIHDLRLLFLSLLLLEHVLRMLPLVLRQPRVVGKLVPVAALVDDAEALRGVVVKVEQLVAVLKGSIIRGRLEIVFKILRVCVVVDPSAAEQARALALLLTDNLAAADAVVH